MNARDYDFVERLAPIMHRRSMLKKSLQMMQNRNVSKYYIDRVRGLMNELGGMACGEIAKWAGDDVTKTSAEAEK